MGRVHIPKFAPSKRFPTPEQQQNTCDIKRGGRTRQCGVTSVLMQLNIIRYPTVSVR